MKYIVYKTKDGKYGVKKKVEKERLKFLILILRL